MTAARHAIELRGHGLFGGAPAVVTIGRCVGPTRIRFAGETATLETCRPRAALLSTELVFPSGQALGSVEHFAAAAAGLGLHRGLELVVHEGRELPLLDGAAGTWTTTMATLQIQATEPTLRVVRAADFTVDGARYVFEPADHTEVHVELRTEHPLLARHASWLGLAEPFTRELAPARTFAFTADLEAYLARGAAPHVAPDQVVIVGDTLHAAGRPADPAEPVRHKLLDLIGDLFVHGGPPRGIVRAHAPGHAKTAVVIQRALRAGVLAAACLAPAAAHAEGHRFVPSPLALPTLDHARAELNVDTRIGFFHGDGTRVSRDAAMVRHGYALEIPLLPRRVYLGAKYAFASGQSLAATGPGADTGETVSGNTEVSIRSLWVAPAGLAMGGGLDVVLPTAYYRPDTTAGDVAAAARAMSPNDWLAFWQRAVGFRPAFDIRIRAAGFTFQLRQSLTFAVGVASGGDSSMVAEVGLYVGQQLGAVQLGIEAAELYYLDSLFTGTASTRTDGTRARVAFMPQMRFASGPLRPSVGLMYSPASAYDGASLLALHLNVDFAL